jgi:hypothetical protein
MAALNTFIALKKFTTHKNQNGKAYILDSIQKMTDPSLREDEWDDESPTSTSTALTPCHAKDRRWRIQMALYSVGPKLIKWLMFH